VVVPQHIRTLFTPSDRNVAGYMSAMIGRDLLGLKLKFQSSRIRNHANEIVSI